MVVAQAVTWRCDRGHSKDLTYCVSRDLILQPASLVISPVRFEELHLQSAQAACTRPGEP